jgi:hypothetical protein
VCYTLFVRYFIFGLIFLTLVGTLSVYIYTSSSASRVTLLRDPLLSDVSGSIAGVSTDSPQITESVSPVRCVLTYGTFEVSQSDCDFLTERDSDENPNKESSQCSIPAGTFLVSDKECSILRTAYSSSDVMKRIDE